MQNTTFTLFSILSIYSKWNKGFDWDNLIFIDDVHVISNDTVN